MKLAAESVDPAGQFHGGTPESIREETLSLMDTLCDTFLHFGISSGVIFPLSKWENIQAYFEAVNDFYKNK